jgi:hypothetical protein
MAKNQHRITFRLGAEEFSALSHFSRERHWDISRTLRRLIADQLQLPNRHWLIARRPR